MFLLLVAAAAVWLLFPRGTPAGNPASGPREESVKLIDRDAATLLRMEVTASDGSAFALVRQGDSFVVEGDPGFPLEEREVSLMVKDLTLLTAHEEAGEVTPGHDLSPLGITENSPRVRAGYADGESVTLIFGDDAHSDIPADYLMLEGDSKVYLVSKETRDHFDRSLATLHPVPGIRFTPDLLDRMVVAGDGAFTLARRGVLWEITSPVRYPADAGKVSSLLRSVGNMRLAVWAGNAEPGALAGFGLLPDRRTVTFHLGASYITGY
ncbi:MAG TPA: DUF4340 domain-containing protein, partial [Candidatus Limnocylindria bacterium]|nr:DUF4340 domain-containing protein [Candidatus Limnocylindria bacterium]